MLEENHKESDLVQWLAMYIVQGSWLPASRNYELLLLWPVEQQMHVLHFSPFFSLHIAVKHRYNANINCACIHIVYCIFKMVGALLLYLLGDDKRECVTLHSSNSERQATPTHRTIPQPSKFTRKPHPASALITTPTNKYAQTCPSSVDARIGGTQTRLYRRPHHQLLGLLDDRQNHVNR